MYNLNIGIIYVLYSDRVHIYLYIYTKPITYTYYSYIYPLLNISFNLEPHILYLSIYSHLKTRCNFSLFFTVFLWLHFEIRLVADLIWLFSARYYYYHHTRLFFITLWDVRISFFFPNFFYFLSSTSSACTDTLL